jgi:hypothetical protein
MPTETPHDRALEALKDLTKPCGHIEELEREIWNELEVKRPGERFEPTTELLAARALIEQIEKGAAPQDHDRVERRACALKECTNPCALDSHWCTVHTVTNTNPSSAKAKELAYLDTIMRDVYENAWQSLAEHPDLDPITVATCKQLRDLERRQP